MAHSHMLQPGYILASAEDTGLWFIFYADDEGVAAIDLTREHPDTGYSRFAMMLTFEDPNPALEKVVLLGGPERPEDALVILHETHASTADSTHINDDFSFLSYNYVQVPGKPPAITTPDNRPSRISLKQESRFLVSLGYRIFDTPKLEFELKAGGWICIPATPEIIFGTPRRERRAKAMRQMN